MKKLYLYFLIFLALVIGVFVLATSPKKDMKNPVVSDSETEGDESTNSALDQEPTQEPQESTDSSNQEGVETTPTPTATPTFIDINEDDNTQEDSDNNASESSSNLGDAIENLTNTCDSSFIYGQASVNYNGTNYKISEDKTAILKGDESFYTAADGFTIQKFNYTGTYLYVIEKNEDGLTYEFVRVTPSNGKRSLFFRWISHENMEDFLINPKTFNQNKVFYLLLTRANSKPRVIVVENYHYSTSIWGDNVIKPYSERGMFYCENGGKIIAAYESGEDLVTEDFALN